MGNLTYCRLTKEIVDEAEPNIAYLNRNNYNYVLIF